MVKNVDNGNAVAGQSPVVANAAARDNDAPEMLGAVLRTKSGRLIRPVKGKNNAYRRLDSNINTNWMSGSTGASFWLVYAIIVFGLRALVAIAGVPEFKAWTYVNVVHGFVSFLALHWIKGSPESDLISHGDYQEMTFYEQLDDGRPWTKSKKLLMLFPTLIFALASTSSNYDTELLLINLPIWITLMLGKLPEFHLVRIFGINSTMELEKKDH